MVRSARSALLIVDVQNDFTEGGALGVEGGAAVAGAVRDLLVSERDRYDLVIASRDWHDGDNDNGGHFSAEPDYRDTWPVHCVAGTEGAEYHAGLPVESVDVHVHKGQGRPAYSLFEGTVEAVTPGDRAAAPIAEAGGRDLLGLQPTELLERLGVDHVDVVGIATDHCVRASALDALGAGVQVRVFTDLVAGVAPETSAAALQELNDAGAELLESPVEA